MRQMGASELVYGPESSVAALEPGQSLGEIGRALGKHTSAIMVSCPRTKGSLLPFASGGRALTLAENEKRFAWPVDGSLAPTDRRCARSCAIHAQP